MGGGGGANLPPGSFLCYSSKAVGARLLTFIVSLLHIIFGILIGRQGPKLLPW